MNEIGFLATVAGVYLLFAASPGPNFIVITHAAASRSRTYAVALGLGVSTAAVLWATLAAAGMGALIARHGDLYRWLQMAGGAYLLYLGLNMMRRPWLRTRMQPRTGPEEAGRMHAWRFGLWTNLTNPKSLAFFGSVFGTLFAPGQPAWLQVAAVGMVALVSVSWNMLVVAVFSNARARRGYQHAGAWVDAASGGLLAYFGWRLIAGK